MAAKTKKKKKLFSDRGKFRNGQLLRGRFSGNINGYGFVAREDGVTPDIFIPAGKTKEAITGDIVEFTLLPGGVRGPAGIVTSIVSRTVKELTGILLSQRFLQPLDNRFPGKIKLKGSLLGGKKGDWLRVKLLPSGTDINNAGKKKKRRKKEDGSTFPTDLTAEVIAKIGKAGCVEADLAAVAAEYGIEEPYTEAENAAAMRIRPRDVADRKDMTKSYTVTIDPGDAKDFDDALSIDTGKRRGEILLGVHIADVASFIRPGSRFAKCAEKRCFSSYMPGMFRPMLPKPLTAKMSLQENTESKAHTILFTIRKEDGKILSCKRFHSLVKVRKRLDYDTVQSFLDDPENNTPSDWNKTLKQKVTLLADLAQKMREIRKKEELFLNIETKEVRALVDPEKMVITGLRTEKQREAELLVEEFMLAANSAAAEEMITKNIPSLYRIHDEPAREKIMEFMEMVRHSFNLRPGDLTFRKDCCRFFDSLPSNPKSGVIFSSFLRSLPRAAYSSTPSLHYGLGKTMYSHFTSPIRRYTDLLIHQQLWAADEGKKLFPEEFFSEKALYCTAKEFQTDEAYFAANDRMKLNYLLHSGVLEEGTMQTFEGIIAKVSAAGILCDIPELGIYGFVPMKYLETRMRYRAREGRYRAEKGRGGYKTGNYIYLVADRIDPAAGKAVFRPVS